MSSKAINRKNGEIKRCVSVYLSDETALRLDRVAEALGVRRSTIGEAAIQRDLEILEQLKTLENKGKIDVSE